MAKLTFVLEDGQEVVVPLKEHITIGRDEDNDIVVDDERISLHHAEIVQNADGSLQVFDLKSTAGTFVNGEQQLSCTLLHGDTIAFGPLVGTLDLEDPANSPPSSVVASPAPASEPPAAASTTPVSPSPASAPPESNRLEETARLEAEKSRLKSEIAAAEKELRDWQQRAENERAMHLARVESLRAEEEKLAPVKAAIKQAEAVHQEWLETINSLTQQHADKSAALERLNVQHYEKSTEVQRLAATVASAQEEIEALATQKAEAAAHLKQVRDECEQDEALLNSLRQQIIEHEKRITEEEARHAGLNAATQALTAKHERDEAAVKDLESLLMSLEQRGAAAEGSLQRMQEDLAACEKKLASRTAELAACEKSIVSQKAELEAESRRVNEARAQRVELEKQNQELVAAKQQLADARLRLAAVEQRYRDAVALGDQNGVQMAPASRRQSPTEIREKHTAPTAGESAPQDENQNARIEAARKELAELEAQIAALRQSQTAMGGESASDDSSIPPPRVIQVETIRLKPIPIKSERTRGPGTKKSTRPA